MHGTRPKTKAIKQIYCNIMQKQRQFQASFDKLYFVNAI